MQYFQDTATKKTYAFNPDVTAAQAEGKWMFKTAHGTMLAVPATLQPIAPPVAPAPTIAQQAAALIGAGFTVTSIATPAIDGTYACDEGAQIRLSNMAVQIARAGNAFPLGLQVLPWPDLAGKVHEFPSVALWLAFEQAVMNFVTAASLVAMTNTGELPAPSATIA